jgi:eukaryotic-like serine/threonine-protein kinase
MNEETLFHEALAKPPVERAAFLDAACASHPALRAAVEALLAAHAAPGTLLEQPAVDPNRTGDYTPSPVEKTGVHVPHDAQPGYVIAGRYTLEQKLGEGGMGEVWVAKQTEPVKRKVALKLIKAGMDSKAVLQRFEAERQALALMDHPHIAKVLDGGLTAARHPFFVMELVNGLPLNRFCDEAKLTPKQRLELFVPICQAVQHAHQKGIIHRDLKPGNILVTLIDGIPVPKVIDFGVAKAIGGKLTEESLSTQFGAVVGTLEYMAPEQAGYSGIDVDTRADIYSLGVILYELLTGLKPFDSKRLRQAALDEIIRIIREEEPSKPSTKLSTDEALPSLAAVRRMEPKKLMALMRGELDWVVMKCLEKQSDRRYETANSLARDIQRYLADEPVEARPVSAGYRIRKFIRRHRAAVTTATLFLLTLLTATTVSLWQMNEALTAEQQTATALAQVTHERDEKEKARAAEAEQRRLADEEKQIAQAIQKFLQWDLLRQADVATQADSLLSLGENGFKTTENPTVRELLDRAAAELAPTKIDRKFPGQPRVQAEILRHIGNCYRGVGDYEKAISFLLRSRDRYRVLLGADHPETLVSQNNLASAYIANGKATEAVPLLQQDLQGRKAQWGPDHLYTLASQHNLALAYWTAEQREQGLTLLEQTLARLKEKWGPDHADALTGMSHLAVMYAGTGKPHQALPLLEQVLAKRQKILGPDHPSTLDSMNHLAGTYQDAGQIAEALSLYQQTLAKRKAILGLDHPDTLVSMGNLASTYLATGQPARAVPLLEQTLAKMKEKHGPGHPHTLNSMNLLASAYRATGKLVQALSLYEQALTDGKKLLGSNHPTTLHSMNNLAAFYWSIKKLDRSIPLFEEALKLYEVKLGRQHPETLRVMANLGVNYQDAGRLAEAIVLLEEAYRHGRHHPAIAWSGDALLEAYCKAGKTDEAAALVAEVIRTARQQIPAGSPALARVLAAGGLQLLQAKAFAAAEPILRECLAIREKTQVDDWATFNTKSLLGGALLGQKKFAEAEPLLVQGYEGMKQREKTIPAQGKIRLTEALQRLVHLYEALGKKDEAARWRKELDTTKAG